MQFPWEAWKASSVAWFWSIWTARLNQASGSISEGRPDAIATKAADIHQSSSWWGIDPSFEYPPPAFKYEKITDKEIQDKIRKLRPYKAPELNVISNSILTHCEKQLTPYLGPIF
jgi:hypothetical protein